MAQFLETHNALHCDLIMGLPTELATSCFRPLDFRGRVAVSHVSRAWRRVALADCGLWNKLTIHAPRPVSLEVLEALLARSGGAPFEFDWASKSVGWARYTNMPDTLLDALERHIGRIGALDLRNSDEPEALARLLQLEAPQLRHLLSSGPAVADLSADWGPRCVPRLETLRLRRFSIPDGFRPLASLTSFAGTLTAGSSAPSLAHVFPQLVKLRLYGLSQRAVRALGAPPPSCRWVELSAAEPVSLDYTPFLRVCYDRRIPTLKLFDLNTLVPLVREFAHSTQGLCRMTVYRSFGTVILESDEDGVFRRAETSEPPPILQEVSCFAYLDRLSYLELSLGLLLGIHALQSPATSSFPMLLSLTIVVDDWENTEPPVAGGIPPLRMPRLAGLVLDMRCLECEPAHENARWLAVYVPGMLRSLISTDRPRLETLLVVTADGHEAVSFASRTDQADLIALAKTLRIVDVYVYEDERPSRRDHGADWLADF
ncbi:hypothetical protein AURDEDRAFT_162633 [Auricularia subglabra TFB-10046 SS5]|nr:hypothetical protein AURDEDRAFT_162633 [Auricularia subglabra TFB-10046 SS5]